MLGDQAAIAGFEADDVGQHGPVDANRQTAGDVPAVVGLRDQDGVGAVARRDLGGDGGGHRGTRKAATEITDVCRAVAPWAPSSAPPGVPRRPR